MLSNSTDAGFEEMKAKMKIGLPEKISFLRHVMKIRNQSAYRRVYSLQTRFALLSMVVLLMLLQSGCKGPQLYQQAYGSPDDPGVVFLHGGPGYNSASFEIGAAEAVADAGYYVVVYDRRGTKRSKSKKADFTFKESSKDLKKVMRKNKLESATLIGHSFGGPVGIRFSESSPEMVDALVLVGAPIAFSETFKAIRTNCRKHYESIGASDQLAYIDILDTMDNRRLDYATYCFSHAMASGLYAVDEPSEEAQAVYAKVKTDPRAANLFSMTQRPVRGFYKQEQYTSLNLSTNVAALIAAGIPVYGIYGDQDGLFNAEVRQAIKPLLGEDHFFLVTNASHSVFLDQQKEFIRLLKIATAD